MTRTRIHDFEAATSNKAQRSPEGIRELFLSEPWLELALAAMKKRLEDGERDALRIYMEAIKVVGATPTVNLLIGVWGGLGVRDEAEAKALIRLA